MELSTIVPPERAGLGRWIDTHTHLWMTFDALKKAGYAFNDVFHMARQIRFAEQMETVVDIWCEAPILAQQCRALADADQSADWAGLDYRFAIGLFLLLFFVSSLSDWLHFCVFIVFANAQGFIRMIANRMMMRSRANCSSFYSTRETWRSAKSDSITITTIRRPRRSEPYYVAS